MEKSTLAFIVLAVLATSIGIFVQQSHRTATELPQFNNMVVLPAPRTLSDVDLIDHRGSSFNLNNLSGRWSLMFFGFTHCPDICPTTMASLKQVKQQLSSQRKWGNYQVIMVSVDPKRDSPEQLSKYVPFFDPEFIGVTGTEQSLTQFAKQVGVLFVTREGSAPDNYEVDHSASIILIDPDGNWAGAIPAPHNVDEMTSDLLKLANFYSADHGITKPANGSKKSQPGVNTAATAAADRLALQRAWVRPAPPAATTMAAYFDLYNPTDEEIQIVDVSSAQFDMAMIHDTQVIDGVAKMIHLDALTVPAQGSVSLMPMSTHIMLVGPDGPLPEGSMVEITLTDVVGTEFSTTIEVRTQPE